MSEPTQLVRLRQELERRFNDEELRTFCQNLGVEYDDLPAQGRANKARELVALMDRRGRLDEFKKNLAEYKPPTMPAASQTEDAGENKIITAAPKARNVTSPSGRELGCIGVVGAFGFRFQGWYRQLPDVAKAATITGIVSVFVALCGLAGTLGAPVVQEWVRVLFSSPTPSIIAQTSATPAITPAVTSSSTPMLTIITAVPTLSTTPPAPATPASQATASSLVTLPSAEPRAAIALDTEGRIYVAWSSKQSGVWDVYFVRSEDEGKTFSAAIRPGAGQAARSQPALAGGAAGVYLAWAEGVPDAHNIYYTLIAANLSVSKPLLVNDDTSGSDHTHPSLAVGPRGILYAAWQDRRNGHWDIYGARLQPGTTSFEGSRVLAGAPGDQVDPVVAASLQGALYVAWTDLAAEPDQIVYACGLWPNFETVRVTGGLLENLGNEQPALALAPDGRAHLAWANAYVIQPTYGVPIYLPAYAATIGKACTPTEALPGSLRQVGSGYRYVSTRPPETAVAATDTAVHVVLTIFSPRDGSYVWYYRAPADGGDFGEPIVLGHEEQVDVLHYPAIAVGPNGTLHVVWTHQYGEQWRAVYTQSTDGGRSFQPASVVD